MTRLIQLHNGPERRVALVEEPQLGLFDNGNAAGFSALNLDEVNHAEGLPKIQPKAKRKESFALKRTNDRIPT